MREGLVRKGKVRKRCARQKKVTSSPSDLNVGIVPTRWSHLCGIS